MKNKNKLTAYNAKLGMRIKVALPRIWCQVNHTSPIVWMKGKIIEVNYDKENQEKVKSIVFNAKWNKCHHYFKLNRMWTCVNKENDTYDNIYICL